MAPKKAPLSGAIDRSHAGGQIPSSSVLDPDGKELDLDALRGKPVLLNLWATWCAPCVVEMPMLDDLAGEYAGKLRVITISQDMRGAEKVVPFFEQGGFTQLEPWMDVANTFGFALAGNGLPLTVLYDARGRELWRINGEYDWSSSDARAAIVQAIAASQSK